MKTGKTVAAKPISLRKARAMQKHIRARAGTWKEKVSGVELLKRTRV